MQEARAGQRRRIDLPQYPKAFVAAARLAKERDRVFVAMPFEDEHPRILWRVIQGVCNIRGLNLRRADSSSYPDLIVADILEEIERAEIVVADLTGESQCALRAGHSPCALRFCDFTLSEGAEASI